MKRVSIGVMGVLALALSGCSTAAGKKAMNKPLKHDSYSGFDQDAKNASKRSAERPKPVSDDTEPEKAVEQLVVRLQKGDRANSLSSEEQLRIWALRQGVDTIVVSKVRPLLKDDRVEVRAPALRLVVQYGKKDTYGDLIECLGDPEYGMREAAIRALKSKTGRDYGYVASGGEVARSEATGEWRRWWQAEQRGAAVQPASVYEKKEKEGKN